MNLGQMLLFWAPVLVGGLVAGGSTGLLGAYVVGMGLPFLGVCVSHAALAGAVLGILLGLTGPMLLVPAGLLATATALLLGLGGGRKLGGSNVLMGMLFSLSMGVAFLGIGLFDRFGRSTNEVFGLLWGSLLLCTWTEVAWMAAGAGALLGFVGLFGKELRAVMFSREQAASAGIRAGGVWTAFLVLVSLVLTLNFRTVGGLMIYSLLANPAAGAFLLARGCGRSVAVSAVLGAASAVGGFLLALLAGTSAGASIVIFSALLVAAAWVLRRTTRRGA
jgi:manganese/iron transport system permease protein